CCSRCTAARTGDTAREPMTRRQVRQGARFPTMSAGHESSEHLPTEWNGTTAYSTSLAHEARRTPGPRRGGARSEGAVTRPESIRSGATLTLVRTRDRRAGDAART